MLKLPVMIGADLYVGRYACYLPPWLSGLMRSLGR